MTLIEEKPDGMKIEYRISPASNQVVMMLESRVLRKNGTPFPPDANGASWYRVPDREFTDLQIRGSIVQLLSDEHKRIIVIE